MGNSNDHIVDAGVVEGRWMNLQDASDATGYSEATLRRYIKRRRVKSRRLGRSVNSKLEVWVTPEMLNPEDSERVSTDGLDEVLVQGEESFDPADDEVVDGDDYTDQATRETLGWFRERLDDKDAKIEALTHQLMQANYRNGYLESQVQGTQEQIKLLTDSRRAETSWWGRFASWFLGRRA